VRYEFGVKVSIVATLKEGLVVGARSMSGNPYDGHTLHEALEQAAILSDVEPEMVSRSRAYYGQNRPDARRGNETVTVTARSRNAADGWFWQLPGPSRGP
jgi:hypothetical protein